MEDTKKRIRLPKIKSFLSTTAPVVVKVASMNSFHLVRAVCVIANLTNVTRLDKTHNCRYVAVEARRKWFWDGSRTTKLSVS